MSSARIKDIYKTLLEKYDQIRVLMGARNLMQVDGRVSMPRGARQQRKRDILGLSKSIYEALQESMMAKALKECETDMKERPESWRPEQIANIRELRKIRDHIISTPVGLYLRRFSFFLRTMQNDPIKKDQASIKREDALSLLREVAESKQRFYKLESPYAALVKEAIPEVRQTDIMETVLKLEKALRHIDTRSDPIEQISLNAQTLQLSKRDMMFLSTILLQKLGFDFQRGRLIITKGRPECAGTFHDARLLVRCPGHGDFMQTAEDVLYQGGIGLSMQNVPERIVDQPAGSLKSRLHVRAMAVFLSQYLTNQPGFWEFIASEIHTFPSLADNQDVTGAILLKEYQRHLRQNRPGGIGLAPHLNLIVQGFKTERNLINKDLEIVDLQAFWQGKCEESLFASCCNMPGFEDYSDLFSGMYCTGLRSLSDQILAAGYDVTYRKAYPGYDGALSVGDFSIPARWLESGFSALVPGFSFSNLLPADHNPPDIRNIDPLMAHMVSGELPKASSLG